MHIASRGAIIYSPFGQPRPDMVELLLNANACSSPAFCCSCHRTEASAQGTSKSASHALHRLCSHAKPTCSPPREHPPHSPPIAASQPPPRPCSYATYTHDGLLISRPSSWCWVPCGTVWGGCQFNSGIENGKQVESISRPIILFILLFHAIILYPMIWDHALSSLQ